MTDANAIRALREQVEAAKIKVEYPTDEYDLGIAVAMLCDAVSGLLRALEAQGGEG